MPQARAQYYEYQLPEDYEMKPETRLKFDALVDEAGLTEIQAQRFLDLHVELMEDYAERLEEEKPSRKKSEYLPDDSDEDE